MDHVQILTQIRYLVRQKFVQLGSLAESSTSESILIRDGFFCGRRFRNDGLEAVWFVEESEIKFYDREGGISEVLMLTPEVLAPQQSQKKAA
jgi:hypothetical protein